MTFDFDRHSSASPTSEGSELPASDSRPAGSQVLDTLKRDRFELLSAYLDSEVTASERRQVEEWLATDPTVQRLHTRLLTLRQSLKTLPTPACQPAEQVAACVLGQLERRRWRTRVVWAATAAAAVVAGALTGSLSGNRGLVPQFAQSPSPGAEANRQVATSPASSNPDALMIALDRPVVAIPKAPVSVPEASLRNIHPDSNHNVR